MLYRRKGLAKLNDFTLPRKGLSLSVFTTYYRVHEYLTGRIDRYIGRAEASKPLSNEREHWGYC